jgi:CHASE3 domain sensor protein
MKWSVGTKIGSGFLFAGVALGIIGVTSYRTVTRFLETSRLVEHTHYVVEQIDAIVANLVNVETGQRGYTLTHDESYLEPFHEGVAKIPQEIATLRGL